MEANSITTTEYYELIKDCDRILEYLTTLILSWKGERLFAPTQELVLLPT